MYSVRSYSRYVLQAGYRLQVQYSGKVARCCNQLAVTVTRAQSLLSSQRARAPERQSTVYCKVITKL